MMVHILTLIDIGERSNPLPMGLSQGGFLLIFSFPRNK